MIPFHRIYSWLFKSFQIAGETKIITRLSDEWYKRIMIIKRSWIFALFVLWIPIVILLLSYISIWIVVMSVSIVIIQYIVIIGNILMSTILVLSSWNYISHFREIQSSAIVSNDLGVLTDNLNTGDTYFINFFNWSITNQLILLLTLLLEIYFIVSMQSAIGANFWILTTDILIILLEIIFLKMYRKRMMDLEMDYNIVVPGKMYFVNQSWVLSSIQTIESDKIKTVRSSFPSRIASFFNYGTVDVLTEWDTQAMIGTMSMYYVTDPDTVVANIQSLLTVDLGIPQKSQSTERITIPKIAWNSVIYTQQHTIDTRWQVRDILE